MMSPHIILKSVQSEMLNCKGAFEKMAKTLFHHPVSPPSRAALLTIRNLGIECEVKVIDIYKGEQFNPEFLRLNPCHQVPVFTEGDFVLNESRAIICYLANATKSKLYPEDAKKRAMVDARLYFDATTFFPTLRDFARPTLRNGLKKIPQERREALKSVLTDLEGFLSRSEWLAGDELTIADVSVLANVGTIKAYGANFLDYPKLNDWFNRCKSFPGFAENMEGAQMLADQMVKVLEEPLWK